jgi:hypothetical protein
MGKPGKTVPSLKKPLGLQMKGSPYSMNQPLHGNAFIGAKVKAEQQGKDSFNVNGKTFPVKKDSSEGPEFVGALLAGAGKLLAKKALPAIAKAGAGVAKGLAKGVAEGALKGGKGLVEVGAKSFGSGSDMSSLVKDVPADPKSKTGMGKALSTIGSSISEGVRGLGEGIAGKAGGSPKGFGDKVKNYIGSLDLITNSNPDGSLKKDEIKNTKVEEVDLGDTGKEAREGDVGKDLKMATLGPSTATDSLYNLGGEISLDKTADKNKMLKSLTGPPEMKGPLNKVKKMCRR